jgi:O-glycosyl hydrolase
MKKYFILSVVLVFFPILCRSQANEITGIPAEVDFDKRLRTWDGFGFNYVEAAQTRNYEEFNQDYGGFSLLNAKQKQEILELVFGENGLDIDIIKMFLDPMHQPAPGEPFDHETTTENMLYFVEEGLKIVRKRQKDVSVITTLYGPPAWATLQKFLGGRDLDTTQIYNLANYMIDWAMFLKEREIPVKYLSIHNEGEDFYRWTYDEGKQRLERFDYNMYWRPEQINQFIRVLAEAIKKANLDNLKVTNGEPSNWNRFYYWGYAESLYEDEEALDGLGLLTTHGFINGDFMKLSYGPANSLTTDLLRKKRPDLHAWVTSFSWGKMDTRFVKMVQENIYTAKVNAVIPWAGVQHPPSWIGGDPNPGTAFLVKDDGTYEITQGYYFYKQLTSAGHRNMAVAHAYVANSLANIIAFARDKTSHPDAFVVTSYIRIWSLPFEIKIKGSGYSRFRAFRTTEDGEERYKEIGIFEVQDGIITYDPPYGSTTTFIGLD